MNLNQKKNNASNKVKSVENPCYKIDRSKYTRFHTDNIIFRRVDWDRSWKGYNLPYDEKMPVMISEGKIGYSKVDYALAYASWIVHDSYRHAFSWEKIPLVKPPAASLVFDLTKDKFPVEDKHQMSQYVKRAAKHFGAALVGICKLNRDWIYANVDISDEIGNAIVIAVEMDELGIATSPAVPAAAATGLGYSKMAFILAGMGEFIRNLGYQAIQCGNDTALSIPLAIDAGLGEIGRNGLLVTPEYGSRVRICKILTDLPLKHDKPIEFGVKEKCRKCKKCAEECEVEAISLDDEPSYEGVCNSNNPGTLKWYVNVEKCYLFWHENSIDCSTCISVCPYTVRSGKRPNLDPSEFWMLTDRQQS